MYRYLTSIGITRLKKPRDLKLLKMITMIYEVKWYLFSSTLVVSERSGKKKLKLKPGQVTWSDLVAGVFFKPAVKRRLKNEGYRSNHLSIIFDGNKKYTRFRPYSFGLYIFKDVPDFYRHQRNTEIWSLNPWSRPELIMTLEYANGWGSYCGYI